MKIIFVLIAACVTLNAEVFEIPIASVGSKRAQLMPIAGEWRKYVAERSIGLQPLTLPLDDYYLGVISLGTPKQNFSVVIDTTSSIVMVINKNCTSQACRGYPDSGHTKNQYDPNKSSTYRYAGVFGSTLVGNPPFLADIVSDTINFGGLQFKNQLFALAYYVSSDIGHEPIDGFFGLGWPDLDTNNMTPPIQNVLPQLSQPLFTLWLDRKTNPSKSGNSGLITYGAIDKTHCDEQVNYIPLSATTYWQFPLNGWIGSYRNIIPSQAISNTYSSWIGAPAVDVDGIAKQTNATYDNDNEIYLVDCNATLPDLVFTIGRRRYNLPSSEYIADYGFGSGKCVLTFYTFDYLGFGSSWSLGTAFLRQYCQVYDVGNNRIGFSRALHQNH